MKVKQGDKVLVRTGKDKGKKSEVVKVYHKRGKVVVADVNICTKHIKKTAERAGEKIKIERAIDASNVMVVCPSCGKAVRVAYTRLESGKKARVCRKKDCGKLLDLKGDIKKKVQKK